MTTEKKDIREYLKYYIDCYCWVKGKIEKDPIKLTGISWDDQTGHWWCYFENTETSYAVIEDVKPILSRLEDMNEEDMKELATLNEIKNIKRCQWEIINSHEKTIEVTYFNPSVISKKPVLSGSTDLIQLNSTTSYQKAMIYLGLLNVAQPSTKKH